MENPVNQLLLQYSYLQVLDFLTTIAFLLNGVREGNPLVRMALKYAPDPLGGLLAVKLAALALGVYCWVGGRERLLSRINILFAVLVAWNLAALILGSAQRGVL
jgi:Domain of unknown function (DUF5658)